MAIKCPHFLDKDTRTRFFFIAPFSSTEMGFFYGTGKVVS